MKKAAASFLVCLISLWAFHPALAAEPQVFRCEPFVSTLSGALAVEPNYGPPNYGENPETDSVEQAFILILDAPVKVIGDPEGELNAQTFDSVQKIQLSAPDTDALTPLVGARVTVTGRLFQHFSGHHHTDVLIAVDTVAEDGRRTE